MAFLYGEKYQIFRSIFRDIWKMRSAQIAYCISLWAVELDGVPVCRQN